MSTFVVTSVRPSTEQVLVTACPWEVYQMTFIAVLSSCVERDAVEARDGT